MSRYLILFLFFSTSVVAQNNIFTLSIIDSSFSAGTCIVKSNDNGFVLGGMLGSDGLVAKIDSNGNHIWATTFPGIRFSDITSTSDFNYVLSGEIIHTISTTDLVIVKIDTNGDTVWTKTLRNPYGSLNGMSVNPTLDTGFLIAGNYFDTSNYLSYAIAIKCNASGNFEWSKRIRVNSIQAVKQTRDGGYVVMCNHDNGSTFYGLLLIRLDSLGSGIWNHYYYLNSNVFTSNDIIESNNSFLLYGSEFAEAKMLMVDSIGNLVWAKSYGLLPKTGSQKIIKTFDNSFVASSNEIDGGHIFKIDSIGDLIWVTHIPTSSFGLVQSADSGLVIIGKTPNSPFSTSISLEVMKLLESGNGPGCIYYDSTITTQPLAVLEDSLTLSITTPVFNSSSGFGVAHPALLYDTNCIALGITSVIKDGIDIFPNPSEGRFTITQKQPLCSNLVIMDSYGKIVFSQSNLQYTNTFDLSSILSKGIYFLIVGEKGNCTVSEIIIF